MTYLEITTRNGLGRRTVELQEAPLRIGRSRENDVVLRDTRVSRHHCVIEVVAGRPVIRDLGSRRGIKVNNRRREESDLRPGDRVRVGPFVIALREESATSSASSPPSRSGSSGLHGWNTAHLEDDSDETATPENNGVTIVDDDSRDESGGDMQASAGDRAAAMARQNADTQRRLDELANHLAEVESTLRERDEAIHALTTELSAMRESQQSASTQSTDAAAADAERDRRIDALRDQIQHADAVAGRLDQFAKDQEQLAIEHAQVARAVQELASRFESLEESLQSVAALPSRLAAIEEAVQQSTMNARQALEDAAQLVGRLEQAQELARAAEERSATLAASQAESAAQIAAHEDALSAGSQRLAHLGQLIEELRERQTATSEERAALTATMQSLSEQLVQMREWSDELEQRLSKLDPEIQAEAARRAYVMQREEWQKELGTLRHAVESLGVRLTSRVERLEGASADAAPELSALKEQVRRLSDSQTSAAAAARSSTPVSRPATSTSTAVMERPKPMPKPPSAKASPPAGALASVDAEQSRQVMNKIFQPKGEQDERYEPARDRSALMLLIGVLVVAMGVALIMLAPTLMNAVAGS